MNPVPFLSQAILRRMALAAVLGFPACASQAPGSGAEMRGVGTPGVSSYVPESQAPTLQALLNQCRQPAPPAASRQGLDAACDQLQRQQHNQPGNAMPAAAAR